MPGEISSSVKEIDDTVRDTVKSVWSDISSAINANSMDDIELVHYKSQLVNGNNYFIKLKNGDKYQHIRVYRSFSGDCEYKSFQDDKTLEDEILYF